MKNLLKVFILPMIACFLISLNAIGVQAKGSSFSSSGSRSSSSSSFSSKSSSSTTTSKPSTSTSSSSTKPSTSSGSASGFKSGSYSGSSSTTTTDKNGTTTTTKNANGTTSTVKTPNTATKSSSFSSSSKSVDTSSPALRSIPSTYSSRSVSNNYYYVNNGSSFDSFMSHYWLYRALEPSHRTYVVDSGATVVAPAYTGAGSVIWDIISFIILLAIIIVVVRITNNRYGWIRKSKLWILRKIARK